MMTPPRYRMQPSRNPQAAVEFSPQMTNGLQSMLIPQQDGARSAAMVQPYNSQQAVAAEELLQQKYIQPILDAGGRQNAIKLATEVASRFNSTAVAPEMVMQYAGMP